jgi:hypothetical protein
MDHKSTYSRVENRLLPVFPRVQTDGKININYFKEIDNYINDRFGFKFYFVAANNLIHYRLLGGKKNKSVLIGKNSWLFLIDKDDGNNLSDFQKTNLFDDAALEKTVKTIRGFADWCKDNGIEFLFFIAPNKHSVYPEYFPFDRPGGITRVDQVLGHIGNEYADKIVFPRDYLVSRKALNGNPLYHETDSHWNKLGAYYGYKELLNKIKVCFPGIAFPDMAFSERPISGSGGDLVQMLGVKSYGKITIIGMEPENGWESYYSYVKNEGRKGIITNNVQRDLPKAIVYRDSFFSEMEPFVSCIFSAVEYIWKRPDEGDKKHILENRPDIVIWEIVERSMGSILESHWN